MKTILSLMLMLFCITTTQANTPSSKTENLRVFVDCQAYCDIDYIKREITYVDYVNDRFQANVYLLITSQTTGSGGREYKLQFEGQQGFAGMTDTKSYIRQATATDDEDRKEAIQTIKLGLLPYILKTDKAKELVITFNDGSNNEQAAASGTKPGEDPWNYWVFNVNMRGYFSGDKNYSSNSLNGGLSASRVTDNSKTDFTANVNRSQNRYGTGDEEFKYTNKRYSFSNTTVWSLSKHLSAGGYLSAEKSDYSNYDLNLAITPAIEYNFYPYSESNNKYMGLLQKFMAYCRAHKRQC